MANNTTVAKTTYSKQTINNPEDSLLRGTFILVSFHESSIKAKNDKEQDTIYYLATLSNGDKVFQVTFGSKLGLTKDALFHTFDMGFEIISSNGKDKLKIDAYREVTQDVGKVPFA